MSPDVFLLISPRGFKPPLLRSAQKRDIKKIKETQININKISLGFYRVFVFVFFPWFLSRFGCCVFQSLGGFLSKGSSKSCE
jgi:hypothetical protein